MWSAEASLSASSAYEEEPGNQHSDDTIGETSSQHFRRAEPEKPVRRKQQREGGETASHVALDADLQVEMASHKPEHDQQQDIRTGHKDSAVDRFRRRARNISHSFAKPIFIVSVD
jgi:hypothetical protein